MGTPRLVQVDDDNVLEICRIEVAEHQRQFVASVPISLAQAYAAGERAWVRAVFVDDKAVAFVQVSFDALDHTEGHPAMLWRLNVAADRQGEGYGKFAVAAARQEARERGHRHLAVSWVPGEGGPEPFYRKLGFVPTGEFDGDEVIATVRA